MWNLDCAQALRFVAARERRKAGQIVGVGQKGKGRPALILLFFIFSIFYIHIYIYIPFMP